MNSYTTQARRVPVVFIVIFLLIGSIVVSQYWLSQQFPQFAGLALIKPGFVFLDIPIKIPVTIDLVLVPVLFLGSYTIVSLFFPSGPGLPIWWQTFQRLKAASAGLFALLVCMLIGGVAYYYAQDYLSMPVKNGINTLGINLDMQVAYPGAEPLALRGSAVLLVSFIVGLVICIRKIRRQPVLRLTREQRITPYERMLQERRVQPAPVLRKFIKAGACDNQPVITLKPLAVSYMPM